MSSPVAVRGVDAAAESPMDSNAASLAGAVNSGAIEARAPTVPQLRYFYHLMITYDGDGHASAQRVGLFSDTARMVTLPLVLLLDVRDADALLVRGMNDVFNDVLLILRIHASSILPSRGVTPDDGRSAIVKPLTERVLYNGEYVSCAFACLRDAVEYQVLHLRDGVPGPYTSAPALPFALHVHVCDKAAEHGRRARDAATRPGKGK